MAEAPKSVYVGLVCELIIAVTKFLTALASGSLAMAAEGIHSSIDAASDVLLLWGVHRSGRAPDEDHPFGHGKEVYFWTLIVALLLFSVGGGLTTYVGILHMIHGQDLGDLRWDYIVLAIAALFEVITVATAFHEFRRDHKDGGLWGAIQASKDPTVFTVLLSNMGDLAGLIIACVGITLAKMLHRTWIDGFASVLIGFLLAVIAILLSIEIKGLLIGEGVDKRSLSEIRDLVRGDPAIDFIGRPLSMYFGPHTVLLAVDVKFRDGRTAEEITEVIDRIEKKIRDRFPVIKKIFIEAESFKQQPISMEQT